MPGLDEYRDRHKGRKCYIFGTGPSLNRFDCDKMARDGVTICCNASIMALKSCDYFMFTDLRIRGELAYYPTVFDKAGAVLAGNQAVWDACIGDAAPEDHCRVFVPSGERRSLYDNDFRFTEPGNRLIAGGVVPVATHIAYIFGCSPIILVGVDLGWVDGQKYFYDRSDRTLWPSLGAEDQEKTDQSLYECFTHLTQIKAQNPSLPIFVANKQSRLCELYPSMDLSEFLKSTDI